MPSTRRRSNAPRPSARDPSGGAAPSSPCSRPSRAATSSSTPSVRRRVSRPRTEPSVTALARPARTGAHDNDLELLANHPLRLSSDTMFGEQYHFTARVSDEGTIWPDDGSALRTARSGRRGRAHTDADHRRRLRAIARGAGRTDRDRPDRARRPGGALDGLRDLRLARRALRRRRSRARVTLGLRSLVDAKHQPDARDHLRAGFARRARCWPRTATSIARCARWPNSTSRPLAAWSGGWTRSAPPGCRRLAGRLAEQGVLRDGVSAADAEQVLWLLTSFESFDLLFTGRGLSTRRATEIGSTSPSGPCTPTRVSLLPHDNSGCARDDRSDRLQGLVEAGIALSSELSLDALLQQLVETAAQLTEPATRHSASSIRPVPGSSASSRRVSTPRRMRRSAICHADEASSAC